MPPCHNHPTTCGCPGAVLLSAEQFLSVLTHAPLVAIDVVVRARDGAVLMGRRINEPAQGCWFVPGGSIKKGETLEVAFERISRTEFGRSLPFDQARLLGAYTHFYDTNFAGVQGIGTHCIVLAYELRVPVEIESMPQDQHDGYRWLRADQSLEDVHPHAAVYLTAEPHA